jgi:hypothetical protein
MVVLETTICEDLDGLFIRLPGERTSEWLWDIACTLLAIPGKILFRAPIQWCCFCIDKCFPVPEEM